MNEFTGKIEFNNAEEAAAMKQILKKYRASCLDEKDNELIDSFCNCLDRMKFPRCPPDEINQKEQRLNEMHDRCTGIQEADLQKRQDIIDIILYYANGTDNINNIKKIARAAQDVFYSERPWFKDFIEDDLCG